ncbi:OmpA/MotB domain protein [Croceitalea dokdonensis DOKDO 023]|uniref:OmpA/MotB domain protein n=1 Tax=Croceitalea dokdonensis DOKDO 023 TaxID=1300341 RepID=A0A0P7AQ93_9FLAO|nr:OmpA family protein [Croceitalea dokdonensis]KPM30947.1 OmpA/MotB domain protein [Croceitalea dokdonensis DOKDO 023]
MKKVIVLLIFAISIPSISQQLNTAVAEEGVIENTEDTLNAEEFENLKAEANKRTSGSERSSQQNKLIKKADEYFEKMWYAEAAELYDLALKKNKKAYTPITLQRAGDAHYFNSEMERAYHWYSALFADFEDELTDADYFRYAHILKGTKRYRKAKRLVGIFNERIAQREGINPTASFEDVKAEIIAKNVTIKNLNINSRFSEFSPMYLRDDQLVFASTKDTAVINTRTYKWNNQPFLDLYVGKTTDSIATIESVQKLSSTLNSKYHEAGVTFSPDHNVIYFTRNNYGKKLKRAKNGVSHLKIYVSEFDGATWSEPQELPFNSEDYSTGHPAMSPDGKKLYFVSDRPGGFGGTDIYVVDVLSNGEFSAPRNLGRGINSTKREMFPFVTETTLSFSSDRAFGFGGLDVYESSFSGDTFSAPINVGEPINSALDDFSYITDDSGNKGYFASNREGGKGDDDIYAFEAAEEKVLEEKLSDIVGTVSDILTKELLPNTLVTLMGENNAVLAEATTDEEGSFLFEGVDTNSNYIVTAKNQEYLLKTEAVSVAEEEQIAMDILLEKLDGLVVDENGVKKVDLDMIYFDFDKYYIRDDAKTELGKLLEVWEKYPDMVIKIESHTDARGPKTYNKWLSDKRAKATRDYLISKGIDASKIYSAIGYGEEYPINDCVDGVRCSREAHQENRRSEFIIISM